MFSEIKVKPVRFFPAKVAQVEEGNTPLKSNKWVQFTEAFFTAREGRSRSAAPAPVCAGICGVEWVDEIYFNVKCFMLQMLFF